MGDAPKHMKDVEGDEVYEARSWQKTLLWMLVVVVVATAVSFAGCFVASCFVTFGTTGGWFNRFWFAFFWVCTFLAGFFVVNRSWLKQKPEKVYLVVALCVTMLFSWSISVRTVGWDIGVHYRNTLAFADWQGDIDHSMSDNAVITVTPLVEVEGGLLENVNAQEEALDIDADTYFETVVHPQNPLWYVTGIEYLPYAFTMRVCRALNVSFSHTLVLTRMTGGIFYVLITYFGMKKLRAGKMLYAVVALLPTSMFLAAEFGYSYWLFSLCLYGFASLVGMIQGEVEVTPLSLAKMIGSLLVGMLPRVVYFPLMFLCLFIPNERFSSVRMARWYRGLILGTAVVTFGVWLVPKLTSGLGAGDSRGGDVNPSAQIQFILGHPLEYAKTFARLVLPPLRMEDGGPDIEGVNLVSGLLSPEASPGLLANYGYLPRTHWVYTVVLWCLLAWTTITDKDREHRFGALPGLIAVILSFGVLVLIGTALYFDFTPVGLAEIHGVQRRYLLPLLFPLLIFMGSSALGMTGKNPRARMTLYNGVVFFVMTAVLLCSWWTSCVSALV